MFVNILGFLTNQIDILTNKSETTNTQNILLSPPTSPIGEKIIYKNMIAEKRFIDTGKRNFQGAKSTTAFLGYLQGFGKGLKYPIDGINFTPFGMTGISNETVDEQVEIEVKTKKMLLIHFKIFIGF